MLGGYLETSSRSNNYFGSVYPSAGSEHSFPAGKTRNKCFHKVGLSFDCSYTCCSWWFQILIRVVDG